MTDTSDITGLLADWRQGKQDALEALSPIVYQELRRLAQRYMARERTGHTLQPTALVNEAFMRLVSSDLDFESRKHFYVIAARMMRRILVDHARAKMRDKRAAGAAVESIDEDRVAGAAGLDDGLPILKLDEALKSLEGQDPRIAGAVEMVYFGGLEVADAAPLLGVSKSTLYDDLRFAKAWLSSAMHDAQDD
ncbi:MAG: ECF-type sigma factor [Woeseiaceae bacterium]|nr:ECF-type sigma factor [Woeseiaceae bacterium]